MAVALRLEFDPKVRAFVERPRSFEVLEETLELDFWTRDATGRENFWMLVAADDTVGPRSNRRAFRRAREVVEAAQRAQLPIDFCFEEDLLKDADTLATWYRLLPYVGVAQSLQNLAALRIEVTDFFNTVERASFDQAEQSLRRFCGADVRAVIVERIHAGDLALANPRRLTAYSVVERTGVRHGT